MDWPSIRRIMKSSIQSTEMQLLSSVITPGAVYLFGCTMLYPQLQYPKIRISLRQKCNTLRVEISTWSKTFCANWKVGHPIWPPSGSTSYANRSSSCRPKPSLDNGRSNGANGGHPRPTTHEDSRGMNFLISKQFWEIFTRPSYVVDGRPSGRGDEETLRKGFKK